MQRKQSKARASAFTVDGRRSVRLKLGVFVNRLFHFGLRSATLNSPSTPRASLSRPLDRAMKESCRFLTLVFAAIGCAVSASGAENPLAAARTALSRGNSELAIRFAKQAVSASPNDPLCHMTLAAAHDAQGEFAKAISSYDRAIELSPNLVAAYQERGEDQFRVGRFKQSVADFDKVIELQPAKEPYHWQRGIALYYAGEFERGARQFDLHKQVNPNDVENAVWHFLCVAKTSGLDQARKQLIPIQRDLRVPFMEIYSLYNGMTTPEEVMKAAHAGAPGEEELGERLFYAHLYIGLLKEVEGATEEARRHIAKANEQGADVGFMGDVAHIQSATAKAAQPPVK